MNISIGNLKIIYKKNKTKSSHDLIDNYYNKFQNFGYAVTRTQDNKIEIKSADLVIRGDSDNTLWTADEVLCNTGYEFLLDEPYIMIDIGFNIGITSLYFARKSKIKAIYGFEPFIPTYNQGLNNLKLNPDYSDKIKLFDYGLGIEDKVLRIPYNKELPGSMSTVFQNSKDNVSSIEEVKIKNAYDVINEIINKHKEKVFVKLDTEGSEFEILPLLSETGLLSKIDILIMEYHKKDPQVLLDILKRNNFFYFQEKFADTGVVKAVKLYK